MNRAGRDSTPSTRAMLTAPASIGPRSASRASARNWRVSSRNRAPRCAREASPGRILGPPPTSAWVDIVWCGARNGRRPPGPMPLRATPATEWMRATSTASSSSSGGSSPAAARASSVFPTPGGPLSARLCRPATATSTARRATCWPMIEPRSGASSAVGSGMTAGGCAAVPRRSTPARWRTAARSVGVGRTTMPVTPAASAAFSAGTSASVAPAIRAADTRARTPGTGRRLPSSASSPISAVRPADRRRAARTRPTGRWRWPRRGPCLPSAGRRAPG